MICATGAKKKKKKITILLIFQHNQLYKAHMATFQTHFLTFQERQMTEAGIKEVNYDIIKMRTENL